MVIDGNMSFYVYEVDLDESITKKIFPGITNSLPTDIHSSMLHAKLYTPIEDIYSQSIGLDVIFEFIRKVYVYKSEPQTRVINVAENVEEADLAGYILLEPISSTKNPTNYIMIKRATQNDVIKFMHQYAKHLEELCDESKKALDQLKITTSRLYGCAVLSPTEIATVNGVKYRLAGDYVLPVEVLENDA